MNITKQKKSEYTKIILLAGALLIFFHQFNLFTTIPIATAEETIEQVPENTLFGQVVRYINYNWEISILIGVVIALILVLVF